MLAANKARPSKVRLRFCDFSYTPWGCWTLFHDGKGFGAYPHDDYHYRVLAHRLGYGDDTLAYCREHELAHHLVAEKLRGQPSDVIWALAHGDMLSGPAAAYEEMAAMTLQRWIRANERPIIAGVNWDRLKSDALALLTTLAAGPVCEPDGHHPTGQHDEGHSAASCGQKTGHPD